jgi:hypothetical protein
MVKTVDFRRFILKNPILLFLTQLVNEKEKKEPSTVLIIEERRQKVMAEY